MMRKLYKIGIAVKRRLPTILAVGAAVGVVCTAVTSGKSAIKAEHLRAEAEELKGIALTRKESVLAQTPAYILPVVSAGLTIACIFGCNWMNKRQQVSLAAASVALQKSFNAYRGKVIEQYGEDFDNAVKAALAEEAVQNEGLPTPTDGNVLVHDAITDSWKCMSLANIRECEYDFNKRFNYFGLISVAEYCDIFGFDVEPGYDIVGWSAEWFSVGWDQVRLDFNDRECETAAGTPYIEISPVFDPLINHEDWTYGDDEVFWKKCITIEDYKERSVA